MSVSLKRIAEWAGPQGCVPVSDLKVEQNSGCLSASQCLDRSAGCLSTTQNTGIAGRIWMWTVSELLRSVKILPFISVIQVQGHVSLASVFSLCSLFCTCHRGSWGHWGDAVTWLSQLHITKSGCAWLERSSFCTGQNVVFMLKLLRLLMCLLTTGASLFSFFRFLSFFCLLLLPFLCLLNPFLSFPVGTDVLYIGPLKGEPHHSHTQCVGLRASAVALAPSNRLPQSSCQFNYTLTALVLCVLMYEQGSFVFWDR